MSTLPSFVSNTPVETPRLRLRPMTSDDVAAAAAIRAQPEVCAYLSHGALTPAQLEARLRLRMARTNLANDTESEVQLVVEALGEEGDATRDHFVQRHDLLALKRGHVIIKRMAGQIEPDGLEFFGQPFGGQPIVAEGKARFGQILARVAEQRHLTG